MGNVHPPSARHVEELINRCEYRIKSIDDYELIRQYVIDKKDWEATNDHVKYYSIFQNYVKMFESQDFFS